MAIKGAFFVTFLTLIENVSLIFYFKAVNAIVLAASRLEAQVIKTTEISEYEHVFSHRHLRNELQCCANSTQARVNVRSANDVITCRATEARSQGGETAQVTDGGCRKAQCIL